MLLARILLAALLVIGFGSGAQTRTSTNAPSAQDNCTTRFRLVNETNTAITELYWGPSTQQAWGSERLRGAPIPPGRARDFDVGRRAEFDFRVVWAGGSGDIMRRHICGFDALVLTRGGLTLR